MRINNIKKVEIIKWIGSCILLVGSIVNGFNVYPAGAIILSLGGCMWLVAAIIIRDMPLIVTNTIMLMAGLAGILYNFYNKLQ